MRKGIPKSQFWAPEKGGIDQVGCVYTAQGFEFDYVGIIFGKDLRFNADTAGWVGFAECSFDGHVKNSKHFLKLVKNTYRVLLRRDLKACYVHFMDKILNAILEAEFVRYNLRNLIYKVNWDK